MLSLAKKTNSFFVVHLLFHANMCKMECCSLAAAKLQMQCLPSMLLLLLLLVIIIIIITYYIMFAEKSLVLRRKGVSTLFNLSAWLLLPDIARGPILVFT
jgi:hypothetical protein